MTAFLEFLFASPAHFFGVLLLVIIVLAFCDSMVSSLAKAIQGRKP